MGSRWGMAHLQGQRVDLKDATAFTAREGSGWSTFVTLGSPKGLFDEIDDGTLYCSVQAQRP